jgi:hypothetical protein
LSDPVAPVPGAKIIRIDQWIIRRKRAVCEHVEVVVDEYHDSLECVTCGAEIDPYVWIRDLADRAEAWSASWDAVASDKTNEINRRIAQHNAQFIDREERLRKLTEQIRLLEQRKERLEQGVGVRDEHGHKKPRRRGPR